MFRRQLLIFVILASGFAAHAEHTTSKLPSTGSNRGTSADAQGTARVVDTFMCPHRKGEVCALDDHNGIYRYCGGHWITDIELPPNGMLPKDSHSLVNVFECPHRKREVCAFDDQNRVVRFLYTQSGGYWISDEELPKGTLPNNAKKLESAFECPHRKGEVCVLDDQNRVSRFLYTQSGGYWISDDELPKGTLPKNAKKLVSTFECPHRKSEVCALDDQNRVSRFLYSLSGPGSWVSDEELPSGALPSGATQIVAAFACPHLTNEVCGRDDRNQVFRYLGNSWTVDERIPEGLSMVGHKTK